MPKPLLVSAAQVRKRMAGPSMARFIAALGTTPTEQNRELETMIRTAQSYFETEGELHLFQTRIVTKPVPAGWVRRTPDAVGNYDKLDSGYDYLSDDWTRGPVQIKLRKRPVLSIEGVSLQWGDQAKPLRVFPQPWLVPNAREGTVNITAIPGVGNASVEGDRLFLPIALGLMNSSAVPTLLHVAYTAGFVPYDFNPASDDLDDACPDFEEIRLIAEGVKAHAALQTLKNTRLSRGAGGGSVAIDGMSQNFQNGRFQQEIQEMADEVKTALQIAKKFTGGGLNMMVG